jgi:hypothetical protein
MIVCGPQPDSRNVPHSTYQSSTPCVLQDFLHAWSSEGYVRNLMGLAAAYSPISGL